jgi:hypothetical protein
LLEEVSAMPSEAEFVAATSGVTPPPAEEAIVRRVDVSSKDAPVVRTALVLSDAILAQLVIKGPLPST